MNVFFMIIIYLFMFYYVALISKRSLHMLQQNAYNENNRYLKWIFKNLKEVIRLDLLNIILIINLYKLVSLSSKSKLALFLLTANYLLIIFTYYLSIKVYKTKEKSFQNKKPYVRTKRVKRMIFTIFVINIVPFILFFFFNEINMLLVSALLTSFNFILIYLVNIINKPVEKIIFLHFKRQAKNKLKSMSNLKVIGITGSYGKTTCKNVLQSIMNDSFNSMATKKSFNTLNGLMICINNDLSKYDEVFIAEMGAYKRGDIKALCKLVKPKYGIITSIGLAHLATFGSEENIIKGKMELVENLEDGGVAVLNYDDLKQRNYEIKNKNISTLWIGLDNKKLDVTASNIKSNKDGLTFDVYFKGDKNKYTFKTRLLGKHNIYNILGSLALANYFKIDKTQMIKSVYRLKSVEHRLELKDFKYFYQIDDAYNANPVGASNALDVLDLMPGEKIVVTPGMIELGTKTYEENKKFGEKIASVADKVILVGKEITKPIKDGLIEKGYKEKNIYIIEDVKKSYDMIRKWNTSGKKEIYALYENDLPDLYIK